MNKNDQFQVPFQLKCQTCGTLAESWHASLPMPPERTAGRGYCECGALGVDSLGDPNRPNMGRVISNDPHAVKLPNT